MKKIVAGLALTILSFSASAELCTIVTKDPRYKVPTYTRNQTSCVNTLSAEKISWATLGKVALVIGAIKGVTYLIEKSKESGNETASLAPANQEILSLNQKYAD